MARTPLRLLKDVWPYSIARSKKWILSSEMKQHPRLIEVLQKSDTGPIMGEADFERNLVGPTIKNLVEKYDIRYTGEFYVNCDDELADRVYQAGMDFASQVGMFNQSTSRRITWTRAEVEEAIQNCIENGCIDPIEKEPPIDDNQEETNKLSLIIIISVIILPILMVEESTYILQLLQLLIMIFVVIKQENLHTLGVEEYALV